MPGAAVPAAVQEGPETVPAATAGSGCEVPGICPRLHGDQQSRPPAGVGGTSDVRVSGHVLPVGRGGGPVGADRVLVADMPACKQAAGAPGLRAGAHPHRAHQARAREGSGLGICNSLESH